MQPVTEIIKPPADNQEDQLREFDTLSRRRVTRVLELRDRETITGDEVTERLAEDVPEVPFAIATVATMSLPRWERSAAAARAALESTLAGSVREDDVIRVRAPSAISSPPI